MLCTCLLDEWIELAILSATVISDSPGTRGPSKIIEILPVLKAAKWSWNVIIPDTFNLASNILLVCRMWLWWMHFSHLLYCISASITIKIATEQATNTLRSVHDMFTRIEAENLQFFFWNSETWHLAEKDWFSCDYTSGSVMMIFLAYLFGRECFFSFLSSFLKSLESSSSEALGKLQPC